jgi:hypothetical protein
MATDKIEANLHDTPKQKSHRRSAPARDHADDTIHNAKPQVKAMITS